ncbi:MAG: hypothetical protein AAB850_01490 [Patescibacteria group bacterium]
MMRGLLTMATFISVVLFPWPLTAFLAIVSAFFEPFVPLAVGLFADTLYYLPREGAWPLSTLFGAGITVIALFVRSRLRADI